MRNIRHLMQMLGLCALILLSFIMPVRASDNMYVRIVAGEVSSRGFAIAALLAGVLNDPSGCTPPAPCPAPALQGAAETSSNASAALYKLRAGTAEFAVLPAHVVRLAQTGGDRRIPAVPGLRSIANLDSQPVFILLRPDVTAVSIQQLAGRRILLGPSRSDQAESMQAVLAAMGLPAGRYVPVSGYDLSDMLARLRNGRADALLMTAAPDDDLRQAVLRGTVKLLEPGKGEFALARTTTGYLAEARVEIDATTSYRTLSLPVTLVAGDTLPAPLVTAVLKGVAAAQTAHPQLDLAQAGLNLPAPLHPAADDFYHHQPVETPHDPH